MNPNVTEYINRPLIPTRSEREGAFPLFSVINACCIWKLNFLGCRHNARGRGGFQFNWVEVEGRQLLVVGERGGGRVRERELKLEQLLHNYKVVCVTAFTLKAMKMAKK